MKKVRDNAININYNYIKLNYLDAPVKTGPCPRPLLIRVHAFEAWPT